MKKNFFAVFLGTVVEYYDYSLYGFNALLLAQAFFPHDDNTTMLIKSFMIFALGSIAKPIGAIVFSHIGDKLGRSIPLRISMLGIIIPTTIIGLLPTYQQIGIWAPVMLALCRIMQGMLVAAEADGMRLVLFENINHKRHNFINALAGLAYCAGIYLANVVTYVLSLTPIAQPWVWRIPFLLGALLGIVVFFLRTDITETREFTKNKHVAMIDTWQLFKGAYGDIIRVIIICGAVGGSYHYLLVFWHHYVGSIINLITPAQAMLFSSICAFVYMFAGPLIGLLADKIGTLRTMVIGIICSLACNILSAFYLYLQQAPLYVLVLNIIGALLFHIPGYVFLAQLFTVKSRYRALAIGHSIGSMLLSGTTPMIVMILYTYSSNIYAPTIYHCILLSLVLMAIARRK